MRCPNGSKDFLTKRTRCSIFIVLYQWHAVSYCHRQSVDGKSPGEGGEGPHHPPFSPAASKSASPPAGFGQDGPWHWHVNSEDSRTTPVTLSLRFSHFRKANPSPQLTRGEHGIVFFLVGKRQLFFARRLCYHDETCGFWIGLLPTT